MPDKPLAPPARSTPPSTTVLPDQVFAPERMVAPASWRTSPVPVMDAEKSRPVSVWLKTSVPSPLPSTTLPASTVPAAAAVSHFAAPMLRKAVEFDELPMMTEPLPPFTRSTPASDRVTEP